MSRNEYIRWTAALALAVCGPTAWAHGDEPHGDEAHPVVSAPGTSPRFEAATETFEMVGRLDNGALTLFIHRFETSEPILQAKVELESGEHKATAAYRAGEASYVLSEPGLLQALSRKGTHPIVVTVTAAGEADLLEATLDVAGPKDGGDARKSSSATTLAGALGLGALGAGGFVLGRRRTRKGDQS